jgi:hypothetical protein
MRTLRLGAAAITVASLFWVTADAHKPITSKYTFNEHVLPIFRERCVACHFDGSVAPMALDSYTEARPWAESIRAELVSTHMPPAQAESGVAPFRNARLLPPRELDVVLTWATGGTPEGPATAAPGGTTAMRAQWPLGRPDVVIELPSEVTLPVGVMERTEEFRLTAPALHGRAIRAIDLAPGMPAMVRRAIFSAVSARAASTDRREADTVMDLWSPARDTTPADRNAAFWFPADAELVARITYRKTWKYENAALTDRSTLGIYFAEPSGADRLIAAIPVTGSRTIDEDLQAVAIRPEITGDRGERAGDVRADVVMPDGSRALLVRFVAQREWPQRFWFARPVDLPRGARIESSLPIVVDVVQGR